MWMGWHLCFSFKPSTPTAADRDHERNARQARAQPYNAELLSACPPAAVARPALQISPRKSFQLKRSASCGDTSLIEAAASVAWQNLELYSSEELDELPVDLVQRLLDKSIEAGKLKLAILQKFTRQPLYHMDLTSVNEVTDEWLVVAHGFALHHLSLAFCSAVTDQGLQQIAHQRNLLSLDLNGVAAVSDAGMQHLAGLTNLRTLNLQGLESVTEAGLEGIRELRQLTSLNLELCENLRGIRPLAGLLALQRLDLGWCTGLTDEHIPVLGRHTRLTELVLSRTQVSHRGLRALRHLGALQRLSLASCQHLDDESLAALPALSALKALSLERCGSKRITVKGFDALARLTALEELNVGYTAAPQASVLQWTTLKRLRVLSLDSCAVEDRGVAVLQHMPALEEVDLSDTVVGNGALEDLPRFNRKLRCINLSYSGVSDGCTPTLARLSGLQRLHLDTRAVGDAGLQALAAATKLTYLDLFGAKVTDKGCISLSHLVGLQSLEMCGGAVTDAGVVHLAPLGRLTHLSLAHNTRVTDVSLPVFQGMTELVFLNLTRSRLTGPGIQRLAGLSKLEVLILQNTRVRRPALDKLHLLLPGLQVLQC